MCQLCPIKDVAAQARWPKPLEAPVKDIEFVVTTAHDDYEANKAACRSKTTIPESLLDMLRLLAASLNELEADREKWWMAPEKKELRRRLDADCDHKKMTELHKINNATSDRIESMQAKLGTFVKWSLGMNGGVWELVESAKVKAGDGAAK
ncbi:hypothetical protein LTR36_010128 [Oleoguttula mirabilis]|uniref:Uncharacterized protein n=1 Tax=Oleoguttula mirabilis TaxID=1507867 RepID=A0AAV9JS05_9PEZI|nr:hypothetical protein LTR36_010128 [Oleoguttula mirabilis]